MALVFKDRVKVYSTTTGTGTFTLGSAVTGFQSFSVIGNGNTTYYTITDQSGNWEVGIGTYTSSGTTLSRTTILSSSNSNNAVDFPAGTKTVFVTYAAGKSVNLDASGNVSPLGTVASGTWQGTAVGIAYGGTGQTTAANAINALVPTQTGNDGKFLKTDGSVVSWGTPASGGGTKSWTQFTSSGTYTVPSGVSSIRAYAFGAGGNGGSNASASGNGGGGGGGGGLAFGDIAVSAGQTVTVTISSGVSTVAIGATTYLTGNKGNNGSISSGGSGGTATKDASVTNGGAYTGGTGGAGGSGSSNASGGGGGSAGSPLGNGYAGGAGAASSTSACIGSGGGGAGGKGGDGATYMAVSFAVGGGGGGAGGAGANGASDGNGGASGGAGGAATSTPYKYRPGNGRAFNARFTDPIMAHCDAAGCASPVTNSSDQLTGSPGGPGAGGSGGVRTGGAGGDFGGGGGTSSQSQYGIGGFAGGGAGAGYYDNGAAGGYAGGGGGCGSTDSTANGGTGGGAIVLIYA